MQPHGVGEGNFEQIVVAHAQTAKDFRQGIDLRSGQAVNGVKVPHTQYHDLKRPNSPEGHEDDEIFISKYDAIVLFKFNMKIIAEQAGAVLPAVFNLGCLDRKS